MNINTIRAELARFARPVPLEGPRYARSLASYEAASTQRQRIREWAVSELIPQCDPEELSILSVGCGAGDLDQHLLVAGEAHADRVAYAGLEPDAEQCERFVAQLNAASATDTPVTTHNMVFEDLREQNQFDLVMMVHSLYYMSDPAEAIEKALGLVADGGRLVILIGANDRLNELSSVFWQAEEGRTAWYSEDLQEYLLELGVAFEQERIEARLDMTQGCRPDSADGNRIADFLAQICMDELPDQLRAMVYEYLDVTCHREGESRWLPHNVDAYIVENRLAAQALRVADGRR